MTKLAFLLRDKQRQFWALPENEVLSKAVISPVRSPVEGSRYQVGEQIVEYLPDGKCRRLKIFGVQNGGFSNVYTVIDLNEMKPYCLKENRALPRDENVKNRDLELEAKISLKLGSHPHLVTTHSVFYYRNRFHILTEYISGRSLDFQLKEKPLDLATALKYALQICRAMLHAQTIFPGFIHGDIKPGNCLITDDNQLKLNDFGQSYLNQPEALKTKGLPGGTYYYMAPEMFDPANLDRNSSDIYAFGITLFEMLAGVRPFSGAERQEIVEQHKYNLPPLNILMEKKIPESVVSLISSCLEKSPSARPSGFAEIEQNLETIYQNELSETAPNSEITKPTQENLIQQGLALSNLADFDRALLCFEEAINQDKVSAEVLAQKAIVLSRQKQFEKGLKFSRTALLLKPDLFTALFVHAVILFESGAVDESFKYVKSALKKEPQNISALNLAGEILVRKQQIYQAVKCFEKSLIFDNSQIKPLENLAQIYFSEGRFDKTVKIAEKALQNDPQNVCLLKILGKTYDLLNQNLRAIECYKKVLSFSPDERKTGKLFVRSCSKLFKSQNIKPDFRFAKIMVTASRLFYEAKSKKSSARFIEMLTNYLFESDLHSFVLWFVDDAVISASDRVSAKFLEDLSKCLQQVSKVNIKKDLAVELLYSVGKIYYHLEKVDDCKLIFNQSLAKFGKSDKTCYYLAACHEIQGDFKSALAFYQDALRFNKICELNRTGAKRVEAKLSEESKTRSDFESKNLFLFRGNDENYI